MSAIQSETGTLAYHDVGSGPILVLLHPFPMDHLIWQPQWDNLSMVARIITPDMRGMGGSSPFPGTPSIDQIADDVATLLAALHIVEPVIVGGCSMGGYAALAFARKYPEKLRGLILIDTKAEADDALARENRTKMLTFLETHPASDVVEQMLPKMVCEMTQSSRPEVIHAIKGIGGGQTPAGVAGCVQALRDRADSISLLPTIAIPTLVIVGEHDLITPLANAKTLAEKIPGATLTIIPDAGHLSHLENPTAVNAAIGAFISTLTGVAG